MSSVPPTPRTNFTSPGLTTVAPLPEVEAVQEILMTMKGALNALGMTFDSLGEQTSKVAAMGPALENAQQINVLRRHIQLQDQRQEQKIDEIKALLKDVLQNEIVEHLRNKVAEHINEQIDEQVRAQVEHQLTHHIPATLQAQVVDQKRQLDEVKRALHNSESRRANSLLRSNHLGDPLHTLYMTNGQVSPLFPKDLTSLFGLDGKKIVQWAMLYLTDNKPQERLQNNWFWIMDSKMWETLGKKTSIGLCNSAALLTRWYRQMPLWHSINWMAIEHRKLVTQFHSLSVIDIYERVIHVDHAVTQLYFSRLRERVGEAVTQQLEGWITQCLQVHNELSLAVS